MAGKSVTDNKAVFESSFVSVCRLCSCGVLVTKFELPQKFCEWKVFFGGWGGGVRVVGRKGIKLLKQVLYQI